MTLIAEALDAYFALVYWNAALDMHQKNGNAFCEACTAENETWDLDILAFYNQSISTWEWICSILHGLHIAEPVKDPISGYPNYSLFRLNCQPHEAAAVAARHWHNAPKLDELIDCFVYVKSMPRLPSDMARNSVSGCGLRAIWC